MSKSLAVLSGSEENSGLSAAIAQLSSVQEKIASIHQEQANVEFFELSELMKDYLGLVGAVKNVFNVSCLQFPKFLWLSQGTEKNKFEARNTIKT